ncbi:hypothetical protein Hanom_Chr00s000618g01652181 [Helianthus anomalus]
MPDQWQGVELVSDQVVREFVGSVVMADLRASKERPSEVKDDEMWMMVMMIMDS